MSAEQDQDHEIDKLKDALRPRASDDQTGMIADVEQIDVTLTPEQMRQRFESVVGVPVDPAAARPFTYEQMRGLLAAVADAYRAMPPRPDLHTIVGPDAPTIDDETVLYLDRLANAGRIRKSTTRDTEPRRETENGCVCWRWQAAAFGQGMWIKTAKPTCPLHGDAVRGREAEIAKQYDADTLDALRVRLDALRGCVDELFSRVNGLDHKGVGPLTPRSPLLASDPNDSVNHPDYEFWRTRLDDLAPHTVARRDLFISDAAHALTLLWTVATRRGRELL